MSRMIWLVIRTNSYVSYSVPDYHQHEPGKYRMQYANGDCVGRYFEICFIEKYQSDLN